MFELLKLENGTLMFGSKVPSSNFEDGTLKSWFEASQWRKERKKTSWVGVWVVGWGVGWRGDIEH